MVAVGLAVSTDGVAQIEEIVITARKREESLQRVPVAVAAFSEQRIDQEAIRTLDDIAALTPFLQFDTGFWPSDTRVSIRGLFARSGRPSAAILIDGIDASGEAFQSAGGSALLNQRLLDIERIEVVRGPQSALYGRAAFAGAINFVTRRPSMDWEAEALLDLGDAGRREVRGVLSGPLLADQLAFRLLGSRFEENGFYRNPNTGSLLGGGSTDGFGLGLLWVPAEDWSAYLNTTWSSAANAPQAVAAVKANEILGPIDGVQLAAVTGVIRAGESDINVSPDPSTGRDFPGTEDNTFRSNIIVEGNLGFATLRSLTSYVYSDQRLRIDTTQQFGIDGPTPGAGGANAGIATANDYRWRFNQYQQELVLISPDADTSITWLAGINGYFEDGSDINRSRIWYRDPNFSLCAQGVPCSFEQTSPLGKRIQRDTTSVSGFGLLGFQLLDSLKFTAEARYIYDRVKVATDTRTFTGQLSPFPFQLEDVSDSVSDTNLLPRFTLDYTPAENILLYTSVAKGIKPPTYNTTDLAAPELNRVGREKLWSYEVGAKTSWLDEMLLFNVALYYNDYRDQQIRVQFEGAPPTTFIPRSGTTNAAKSRIRGTEIELVWMPMEQLTLSASHAWTQGDFLDYNLSVIQPDPTVLASSEKVKAGNPEADFTGNDMPGIPRNSVSLLARYQQPLVPGIEWFGQVTGQYEGRRKTDVANLVTLDSYWLANLQVGLQGERWELIGYVNNVTDDRTIRFAQEFIDQQTGLAFPSPFAFPVVYYAYLPDPRTFGLRFAYRIR